MWRGSAVPRKALRARWLLGPPPAVRRHLYQKQGSSWLVPLLAALPPHPGGLQNSGHSMPSPSILPHPGCCRSSGGNRKTSELGALGGRDLPRASTLECWEEQPGAQGFVRFLLSSFCSDNSGTGSFIHSFAQHLVIGHLPTLRAAAVPGAGGSAVTTHTCLLLSRRVRATERRRQPSEQASR